jgi:proline dehydrogenase
VPVPGPTIAPPAALAPMPVCMFPTWNPPAKYVVTGTRIDALACAARKLSSAADAAAVSTSIFRLMSGGNSFTFLARSSTAPASIPAFVACCRNSPYCFVM